LIWLRGEQIKATINLERIRADDFRAESRRDFRSYLGFPCRRRTDDEEDAVHD
jgi:hypothetical protein